MALGHYGYFPSLRCSDRVLALQLLYNRSTLDSPARHGPGKLSAPRL